MKVEEPDYAGSYTYADYMKWTVPDMMELIRGKIYKMSPAPRTIHQQVAGILHVKIGHYLIKKKCQVFMAPFDVRLPVSPKKKADKDITTVVQPDICVVCNPSKIDEHGCLGAPDWIIEVLSPRTSAKDLSIKFEVYEEAGVREYWVIHPTEQTLMIYTLNENGKYEGMLKPYIRTDQVSSIILPDLKINLEEIFPEQLY
ncbi:MAG: Uma2 family endonuclease [Cyclobacteriaceae bacterium]|nr:Uma2 family endonuclease [Cyclobacteriaceae bacterium]